MARTLKEIAASKPYVDLAKVEATTDADIERHMREDDSAPAGPLSEFVKRKPGQRGPGKKPAMVSVSLRLPRETAEALRSLGPGWQVEARRVLSEAALVAGKRKARSPGR